MASQNPPLSQQDEAVLEAAGVISALANEMKLGRHPGTTAAIVQQSSTPVLVIGGMMLMVGIGLTVWNLALREAEKQVQIMRDRELEKLTQRVDLGEVYRNRHEARINALENPPPPKEP